MQIQIHRSFIKGMMAVVRNIITGNREEWHYALDDGPEFESKHKRQLVDLDHYFGEHRMLNVNQIWNVLLVGPGECVTCKPEIGGVIH